MLKLDYLEGAEQESFSRNCRVYAKARVSICSLYKLSVGRAVADLCQLVDFTESIDIRLLFGPSSFQSVIG